MADRRITGSRGDEADPFLPVASGEAHRVLKERRVTLLTWGAVHDPGESEHLSRPDGHPHSLTSGSARTTAQSIDEHFGHTLIEAWLLTPDRLTEKGDGREDFPG